MRVRATLHLRNDTVLAARQALGLSQKDFALGCECTIDTIRRLEKMDFRSPRVRRAADKMATFLDIPVEQIMPESLANNYIPHKFTRITEIPASHLLEAARRNDPRLLPSPADSAARQAELSEAIDAALACLSYREGRIIKARFGLGGEAPKTLTELGVMFSLSGSRIRELEMRALRTLQRPHATLARLDEEIAIDALPPAP